MFFMFLLIKHIEGVTQPFFPFRDTAFQQYTTIIHFQFRLITLKRSFLNLDKRFRPDAVWRRRVPAAAETFTTGAWGVVVVITVVVIAVVVVVVVVVVIVVVVVNCCCCCF